MGLINVAPWSSESTVHLVVPGKGAYVARGSEAAMAVVWKGRAVGGASDGIFKST